MASKNVTVDPADKIVVKFEFETERKNMVRFSELPESGNFEDHLVGKFYFHKAAWKALGEPTHLELTVVGGGAKASGKAKK